MPPISFNPSFVGGIIKLAAALNQPTNGRLQIPLYVVGRIVYNVYFHPLRKYPGPFWHRATTIPYVYKLVRGRLAYDVANLHEQYGPVVRIMPDSLSFVEADAWKDIYGHRTGALAGTDELPKSPRFYTTNGVRPSIISESRENHAVLRRHLAHGFSDRSMRLQEPIIGSYVDLLIRRLREHCVEEGQEKRRKPVDMKSWINFTTFDIIGDLAFGEPFGCLENAEEHPWVAAVNKTVNIFGPLRSLNYLGLDFVIKAIIKLRLLRSREAHLDKTSEKLRRRTQLTMERPDLIEGLLRVKNIDFERLRINASTLIVAGSETTATLLAGAVFLLLTNPDKLQRLTDEVRGTYKDDAQITLTSVQSLTYMFAVLEESLRRYPPVAIGMPRQVPRGGTTIAGHEVPEGTEIAVWHQACYQSKLNFEDPLAFKPERWLHEEGKQPRDRLDALQPFHLGPRNCIGKNLAYAEMRLVLAKLLFNFDMELVNKEQNWLDHPVYLLRDKPALWVYLTPVAH